MKLHAILIFWINKPLNKKEFAVRSYAYGQGDIILYFIVRIIIRIALDQRIDIQPKTPTSPPTNQNCILEGANEYSCV